VEIQNFIRPDAVHASAPHTPYHVTVCGAPRPLGHAGRMKNGFRAVQLGITPWRPVGERGLSGGWVLAANRAIPVSTCFPDVCFTHSLLSTQTCRTRGSVRAALRRLKRGKQSMPPQRLTCGFRLYHFAASLDGGGAACSCRGEPLGSRKRACQDKDSTLSSYLGSDAQSEELHDEQRHGELGELGFEEDAELQARSAAEPRLPGP